MLVVIEQWKRVVWSDESPLGCKNQSQQHVWRTKQETGVRGATQGTVKSINVWGCFSWNGVGDLAPGKGYFDWDRLSENFDSSHGSISQSIKP